MARSALTSAVPVHVVAAERDDRFFVIIDEAATSPDCSNFTGRRVAFARLCTIDPDGQ